jgi:hypothetical protein
MPPSTLRLRTGCRSMYRDGDDNLRWEGKFQSTTQTQRRLTSVLGEIDRGAYTRPSSLLAIC